MHQVRLSSVLIASQHYQNMCAHLSAAALSRWPTSFFCTLSRLEMY